MHKSSYLYHPNGPNVLWLHRTSLCAAQQPRSFQCFWHGSLGYCMHCFLVLCHLGELVILSTNSFDPIKHVAHSTLLTFHMLSNGMEYSTCQIPWMKTMLHEGASISITAHNDPLCPIKALKHHLSCSKSIPSHTPLFLFKTADGGWSPMTKGWFMACWTAWYATSWLPNWWCNTPSAHRCGTQFGCSARSLEIKGVHGLLEENWVDLASFYVQCGFFILSLYHWRVNVHVQKEVEVINFLEPCSIYGRKNQAEIIDLILSYYLQNQLALVGELCLWRNAVFSDPSHGAQKPGSTLACSKLLKFLTQSKFPITPEMRSASFVQVLDLNSANSLRSVWHVLDPSHMHVDFQKLSPYPQKFRCSTNSRFKLNFHVLSHLSISMLHTKQVKRYLWLTWMSISKISRKYWVVRFVESLENGCYLLMWIVLVIHWWWGVEVVCQKNPGCLTRQLPYKATTCHCRADVMMLLHHKFDDLW